MHNLTNRRRYMTKLIDKFKADENTPEEDLGHNMDEDHFSHYSELNQRVYNVTRPCARWILRSCFHTLPIGEEAEEVMRLKGSIKDGWKGDFPKKPIRINTTTNTIEYGCGLLFALGISEAYGTYMPIEFVE
jgi:hypothetical protein